MPHNNASGVVVGDAVMHVDTHIQVNIKLVLLDDL